MIGKVLAAAAVLFLAGCAGEDATAPTAPASRAAPVTPAGPAGTVSYRCDNDTVVTIAWGEKMAEVSYDGEQWPALPQALSGSGARYADGTYEVWEHQGTVRVTGEGVPATECAKAR